MDQPFCDLQLKFGCEPTSESRKGENLENQLNFTQNSTYFSS